MHLGASWDDAPIPSEVVSHHDLLIDTALSGGIRHFDHADIYCRGKSETLFGNYLSRHPDLRKTLHLTTKCGIRFKDDPTPGVPGRYDFSPDYIIASVDGSLRRLQTDYIDTLLLHRPDLLGEPQAVAEAFVRLKEGGKVRAFGVSNHNAQQIRLLQKNLPFPLTTNQLECSLVRPELIASGAMVNRTDDTCTHTDGLLDFCRLENITIEAYSPLARGTVTTGDEILPSTVQTLAAEYGVAPETIAFAWLLRHPAGIVPVTGTTNPQRLEACLAAHDLHLTREHWYQLLTAALDRPLP